MRTEVLVSTAVADVLEAAVDHVRAGWTQHRPFDFVDGRVFVCANGALWLAAGLSADDENWHNKPECVDLWRKAMAILGQHVGQDSAGWNDSIGQTQERVADTMLRLAKELRSDESS